MNILLASPVAKKIDSATLAGNKNFILGFEKSCGASLHFSLKGFGQVLKKISAQILKVVKVSAKRIRCKLN